jgi:hypothetical protein
MRASFPTASSTLYDPVSYSPDPWAASAWAPPAVSNRIFTNANWNWMQEYGENPQGFNPGYFLWAWARSEAAQMSVCSAQGNTSKNK